MKHKHSNVDIPRDRFGDELDEPAPWETAVLICVFPFFLAMRALGALWRAARQALRRVRPGLAGHSPRSRAY